MKRECETCIKRKTTFCPTSMECIATEDMPYYQNRIMLLEENQKLKDNWIKLRRKIIDCFNKTQDIQFLEVLQDMQELESENRNE